MKYWLVYLCKEPVFSNDARTREPRYWHTEIVVTQEVVKIDEGSRIFAVYRVRVKLKRDVIPTLLEWFARGKSISMTVETVMQPGGSWNG